MNERNVLNCPTVVNDPNVAIKCKKKKKKLLYNTTSNKGANSLAPIFLSRRVKLIVTSERLNIFKKCFHQSKFK